MIHALVYLIVFAAGWYVGKLLKKKTKQAEVKTITIPLPKQ